MKDMFISEVIRKYPETVTVMERCGLGCAGCAAALFETIEEGAAIHSIDADLLTAELNRLISAR